MSHRPVSYSSIQDDGFVALVSSFVPKGRYLRKKCGTVKASEVYTRDRILITDGLRSIEYPPSNQAIAVQDGGIIDHSLVNSNRRHITYVPSLEFLALFRTQVTFLSQLLPIDGDQRFMILQTAFKFILDTARSREIRAFLDWIFNSSATNAWLWLNEFHSRTFTPQRFSAGESLGSYRLRLAVDAIDFLHSKHPGVVVLVSDTSDPILSSIRPLGIPFITMESFLSTAQALRGKTCSDVGMISICDLMTECQDILRKFRSVADTGLSLGIAASGSAWMYPPHWSSLDVSKALKSGGLREGTFVTSAATSTTAEVVCSDSSGVKTVRIINIMDANRAMNGDIVAIQLYPIENWVPWNYGTTRLFADDEEPESPASEQDAARVEIVAPSRRGVPLVPTGKVVGILQASSREADIVAVFPSTNSTKNAKSEVDEAVSAVMGKEEFVLVYPLDRALPKMRIRTRQRNWLEGKKIVIRIDSWNRNSQYPDAHFVHCLGDNFDFNTEITALLTKYGVSNRPFSMEAMSCLPDVFDPKGTLESYDCGWKVDDREVRQRRDYRKKRNIFSVDPPGCQDIDDAMHVRWLGPGKVEIGVHIADVCAFIPQGCALDVEAQRRGTTVYLPHTRIDMLPSLLSSDIASLHAKKDRYAVTMEWTLDIRRDDGDLVTESDFEVMLTDATEDYYRKIHITIPDEPSWCGRIVMNNIAAMTYEQADELITRGNLRNFAVDPVYEYGRKHPTVQQAGGPIDVSLQAQLSRDLRLLTLVSRKLLSGRMQSGAVDLQRADGGGEVRFKFGLDPSNPEKLILPRHLEVHETIAELMIVANSAVAKILYDAMPTAALVRVHAPPSTHKLQNMRELCEQIGVSIFESQDPSALVQQIPTFKDELTKTIKSHGDYSAAVSVLTNQLIFAMSEALYICSGASTGDTLFASSSSQSSTAAELTTHRLGHYGLGVKYYTHYTSPIRRYADEIVHRQLLYVLQNRKDVLPLQVDEGTTNVTNQLQLVSHTPGSSEPGGLSVIAYPSISYTHVSRKDPISVKADADELDTLLGDVGVDVAGTVQIASAPSEPIPSLSALSVQIDSSDVDFLDDLLGDVGDDLMSTLKAEGNDETLKVDNPCASYASALGDVVDVTNHLLGFQPCVPAESTANLDQDIFQISVDGPGVNIPTPPYSSADVFRISSHLNKMNRNSKRIQSECQDLFLALYFKNRVEEHSAIVYSLKENGFVAYIPHLDCHVRVIFESKQTHNKVSLSPRLLKKLGYLSNHQAQQDERSTILCPSLQCILSNPSSSRSSCAGYSSLSLVDRENGDASLLTVRPLQSVRLLVTSRQIASASIRIEALLVDVNDAHDEGTSGSFAEPGKNKTSTVVSAQEIMAAETKYGDIKSAKTAKSIYSTLQSFLAHPTKLEKYVTKPSPRESSTATGAQKKASQDSKPVISMYRLKGTGRIAFGDETFVTEIFLATKGEHKSSDREALGSSEGILHKGKQSAMAKMKMWGEVWAEEEDLPDGGVFVRRELEANESKTSATKVMGDSGPIEYRKDVANAMQRMNKLKVAKRQSKFG